MQGKDTRAETLVASYERAGYARVAPAMLQPAEPFLDLSGEEIRRRMYLTTAPDGDEFCLRPDLTIPVSRDYLASPRSGKPTGYCYLGPVFRHRTDAPAELLCKPVSNPLDGQTRRQPMPRCCRSAWKQRHTTVSPHPTFRSATSLCLQALLPNSICLRPRKRRLIKDFNRKTNLAQDLDRLTLGGNNARPEYQGVLAALAGSDPKAARALVTDLPRCRYQRCWRTLGCRNRRSVP